MSLEGARWRKSSYTNGGGDAQCVELARLDRETAVRDSKQPGGPVLVFPARAFRVFVAGVR
ncbi:DUF397 domain-containing protein [Actinosynnema sp. NPDC047251]|uniref:DUF397 domain-containing protein n=1 Tax=Saccharothrix espanaensis (strain ATCC 51144 / DSM 44229 / JCM 9112 / NBRC 15066 / NRRL 15764) TaxID=1179773 RepID=K0KFA7_SACES|nr:DUF397 domain-containing protein [Saccharothrix espanaensis]CCH35464.1 hypothetical protein BN6_82470 [Saccharothrix espanaensis DSM 44229]